MSRFVGPLVRRIEAGATGSALVENGRLVGASRLSEIGTEVFRPAGRGSDDFVDTYEVTALAKLID